MYSPQRLQQIRKKGAFSTTYNGRNIGYMVDVKYFLLVDLLAGTLKQIGNTFGHTPHLL